MNLQLAHVPARQRPATAPCVAVSVAVTSGPCTSKPIPQGI